LVMRVRRKSMGWRRAGGGKGRPILLPGGWKGLIRSCAWCQKLLGRFGGADIPLIHDGRAEPEETVCGVWPGLAVMGAQGLHQRDALKFGTMGKVGQRV
jgi:hypothetical protein